MAGFTQIIEFTTTRFDEVDELTKRWEQEARAEGGQAGRVLALSDRDRPNTYYVVAEFPSYEAAMKNNELAVTKRNSDAMAKLCDSVTFRNCDVVADATMG